MDTATIVSLLALIGILIVAVLLFSLSGRLKAPPSAAPELTAGLQAVSLSVNQSSIQAAAMAEKLSQLEPATRAIGSVQVELRALVERLAHVEQGQANASRGFGDLSTKSASSFVELRTIATSLIEATAAMRDELARAKTDLTEIKAHERADKDHSALVAESVRRLEMVMAGTNSKGAAGENILELIFANLPQEWQVRDFKVGGKQVEFGLRLPNNLILPVDSKWPATDLLERFAECDIPEEQQRLRKEIESCVLAKAKEVEKYIDPSITVNMAVAVVPDAVYDLCPGARVDAFARDVAIISYRMFVPYLLLVYQTTASAGQTVDMQKLSSFLQSIDKVSRDLLDEIDGRLSRGLTMVENSRDQMRIQAGKLASSVVALKVDATPVAEEPAQLPASA